MFATLELTLKDDSKHKRLKVGRACHPCRMKKIKCDGKHPCMQCKARRRKCMYLKNTDENYIRIEPLDNNSETANQSSSAPQHIDNTNNRIYTVDKSDHLFATQPYPNHNSLNTHSQHQSATTRPDKMIEQLTNGLVQMSLNNHNENAKLDHVTPWRSYGEFVRWIPEPHLPAYYNTPIDMPSRPTQEHLISVFFSQCHHLLPILSRSMFYDQLRIKGTLITPLLLNVMYAHAAKQLDPNSALNAQGDIFYHRARKLMDDFLDVPRISTVIALIYMAFYESSQYRHQSSRAWMYSGMAIRMCFQLGLHTCHYSSQMSQCDIELRKRVLWACFVMDKVESCTMERPWMLKSKDITIDLPNPLPEDTTQERLVLEAFNQVCRLMMLVEKVVRFFAYDMSIWTMNEENQIVQFLDALHRWREMLPPELQWTGEGVPATAAIANLYLISYDFELSLVMCCRQEEQIHRDRRRTLANTITHIVSLTVHHPHLMYNHAFSAFSGIFAALTHVVDFNCTELDVAETARIQFRKSLEDIRLLAGKISIPDLRDFSRLIDLTLQPKHNNGFNESSYTSAFSAISELCHHKENEPINDILADRGQQQDVLDNSQYMLPNPFALDTCYQVSGNSSPSGSVSAAAMAAAAAAAVGAVGTPGSTSRSSTKSIEPADYTFELISVADEWAQSLMY
ncbi:hypothetical protein G6F46_003816 [Rhizopus delemar]|nr:hypothetical protein G6F43_003231 [Rhizopus delemar]KAG1547893.1 hypothetical protein G6F51_003991 [Rhizopus arrhizus]KAG1462729.1 hypothetical protein G6F55_002796 [Rhizopus delemar]KAG1502262.1 hypothetical protein G6F54_002481 [Rhizopus delemar]KAG1517182.1 hypothetical protein G6F53_001580 [Rhizopus delemar]